jgi:hypothetical protein
MGFFSNRTNSKPTPLREVTGAFIPAPPGKPHYLAGEIDRALAECQDALAKIVDPPTPQLHTLPEAEIEHRAALEAHAETCKDLELARAKHRRDALASFKSKVADDASDLEWRAENMLAQLRLRMAECADPPAPELGYPSDTLIAALMAALAVHPSTIEANEKRRNEARLALRPKLIALHDAAQKLNLKPSELFDGRETGGERISVPVILKNLANLTPQLVGVYRSAIAGAQ